MFLFMIVIHFSSMTYMYLSRFCYCECCPKCFADVKSRILKVETVNRQSRIRAAAELININRDRSGIGEDRIAETSERGGPLS